METLDSHVTNHNSSVHHSVYACIGCQNVTQEDPDGPILSDDDTDSEVKKCCMIDSLKRKLPVKTLKKVPDYQYLGLGSWYN